MDFKETSRLVFAILVCEIVGVGGAVLTAPSITTWYAGLAKPFFTPPAWVFGPVWAVLYSLMGVSLYLVWELGAKRKEVLAAIRLFGIQLSLNFLWTILFFGLHSPLLGLVDIALLWVAAFVTMASFYRVSARAGAFLVPYLFWVTIASLLNLYIFILN